MAGDHKCPVCQATFTRPQHVARHMRSHTGDRPYKCQHCGDQFARSDLLSRHINKCHASEKPATTVNARRKGTSAASRATTSKQACDQCVQGSLPCDGSNPCSKCIQRKSRCTFVKFHRQTAPAGPGHIKPEPLVTQPPSSVVPSTSSSARKSAASNHGHSGSTGIPRDDYEGMGIPSLTHLGSMNAHGLTNGHDLPRSSGSGARPTTSHGQTSPHDLRPMSSHNMRPMSSHEISHHRPSRDISISQTNRNAYPSGSEFLLTTPFHQNRPAPDANNHTVFDSGYHFPPTQPDNIFRYEQQSEETSFHEDPSHFDPRPPQTHPFALNHNLHHDFSHPLDARVDLEGDRYRPQLRSMSSGEFGSQAGSPFNQDGTSQWGHHPQFGHSPNALHLSQRRGSEAYSSDGSYSGSGNGSVPPSASSSSVQLPLVDDDGMEYHGQEPQDGFPLGEFDDFASPESDYPAENSNGDDRNGGFSSAFGLMSLEAPDVLAGLTQEAPFFSAAAMNLPPEDPNATPMGNKPIPGRHQRQRQPSGPVVPRETETKELREFWKAYMRTPTSGPNSAGTSDGQSPFGLNMRNSPGRRQRVNSMPSVKTPTLDGIEFPPFPPAHAHSGMPTARQTIHGNPDDLRSYEAAVLARQAPTQLTIGPKKLKKSPQVANSFPTPAVLGSMAPPPSMFLGDLSRPSSTDGRSPDVFSNSSESPDIPGGSGGSGVSGLGIHAGFALQLQARHAGSQTSFYSDPAPLSRHGSFSSTYSCDSVEEPTSGASVERRPSFKRLPSQTLGPTFTKRTMLGHNSDVEEEEFVPTRPHYGQHRSHEMELGMGNHPDRVVIHLAGSREKQRRLSMPSSPPRHDFGAEHAHFLHQQQAAKSEFDAQQHQHPHLLLQHQPQQMHILE